MPSMTEIKEEDENDDLDFQQYIENSSQPSTPDMR